MFSWVGQILINVSCTLVGVLIGYLLDPVNEFIQQRLHAPEEKFVFPLSAKYGDLRSFADFRYILVRYGSDDFVRKLPLKQTEEARFRLTYGQVELTKADSSDTGMLVLTMPVHDVLGAQFKMFAVQHGLGDAQKLSEMPKECCKDEISITNAARPEAEVWFILNPERFPSLKPRLKIVETDENKILNNWIMAPRYSQQK